jgi:cob(I)alamin adenosyltransferase
MTDDSVAPGEKMQAIKAERTVMMTEKKIREKGLAIVHTENGKGKSASAFGMIMRCGVEF